VLKTSGSLKLRDEICVEAGAISMESVGNGAPVNSSNHRINGDFDKHGYTSGLKSPRQMIDKAAGQTTRMSEYYGATKWFTARIVANHADHERPGSVGDYDDFTPKGINPYPMDGHPEGLSAGAYLNDTPAFFKAWGTANKGFSRTRGEWVDLTRMLGFCYNNYPSSGTPYVVIHHNTSSQRLSAVLGSMKTKWGSYSGKLMIQKLTRKDGAKAESFGTWNTSSSHLDSDPWDGEDGANVNADGMNVTRMYWYSQNFGPDTNGQYGLQSGDTFLLWFDGVRPQ